jgi:hypothetical protein
MAVSFYGEVYQLLNGAPLVLQALVGPHPQEDDAACFRL